MKTEPEPEPEPVDLDIGPTELLNPDHGRAKIDARPGSRRAPSPRHLRQNPQVCDDTKEVSCL